MMQVVAAALAAGLIATVGASAEVRDTSFSAANGERTLEQSIDINGSPVCVWRQFTDETALKAQGIALAHVDLRTGGLLEEGFSPDAKPTDMIRHQIIAYLPERLLVLRNLGTPPGVPGAAAYPSIVQVITIAPTPEGATRLTIAHTGYRPGPDFDALYGFFRTHNPQFLEAAAKVCGRTG